MKEKAQESSQDLGSFVSYNQYHLNELTASYDNSLQKIKVLEKQLEKNELFTKPLELISFHILNWYIKNIYF